MDEKMELEDVLEQIESADAAMVSALENRAKAYRTLAQLKEKSPERFVRLPRDEEIIAKVQGSVQEFPKDCVEPLYRELLSVCANLITPRKVAYLGEAGGFAHLAARKQFGKATCYEGVESVVQVLELIVRGTVEYGVLPLETSSDGAVTATLLGLQDSEARVCAELTVDTTYHLLCGSESASDVEKVYGTRGALAACSRHLGLELPHATLIDVPNAELAAELLRGDTSAAIVGTSMLCELHGLHIVREAIQDIRGIATRFAIVGRELPSRTGSDRTIVAVAVHNRPGALHETLKPFASREVNLTKLESRPTPQWRYLFFLEMDGHVTDRSVLTALEDLRTVSRYVRVMGSYPVAPKSNS